MAHPIKRIITNKIRCKHCGDIIESRWTHEFVRCSCKSVAVDGGHEYLRREFHRSDDYEELSELASADNSPFKDVLT